MKRTQYDDSHRQKVRDLKTAGMNDSQIAKETGINYQTIRKWLAAPRANAEPARIRMGAIKRTKQSTPEPNYRALIDMLISRLRELETDVLKQSVLRFVSKKPQYLELVAELYAGEKHVDAASRPEAEPNGSNRSVRVYPEFTESAE